MKRNTHYNRYSEKFTVANHGKIVVKRFFIVAFSALIKEKTEPAKIVIKQDLDGFI